MRTFPLEISNSVPLLSATFKKNHCKHGSLYLVDMHLHTSTILHGYFLSLADLALRSS